MLSQARGLLAASSTLFGASNTKKASNESERPRGDSSTSPGNQADSSKTNRSANWRGKFTSDAGKLANKSNNDNDAKKSPAPKSTPTQSNLQAAVELSEPNSSSSSSSLNHNDQRQRARHSRHSSTPSCGDLSSGYLSQTNGHLASNSTAPVVLRPQPVGGMSDRNQTSDLDLNYTIRQNVHTNDRPPSGRSAQAGGGLYHTHSIASSSTLTRLPMVPMMIDDEDEQIQFEAENDDDDVGQNVLVAGDDFSNSAHRLHSHQSYQSMIDGLKRRQRQLQRQQQLEAMTQHDDHLHHHLHHLPLHHPLSQRLAIDEMSLGGERADSEDRVAHDFAHRHHYNHQFDYDHQLAHHLAFALSSSQNPNALRGYVPRDFVRSQAHEASASAAAALDELQLARELAFKRSQFSTVNSGQHYTKLNHLTQQQQRTLRSSSSSKSAGVGGASSSSTSSGKYPNHLQRLKSGPTPPAPPVRGQQQVVVGLEAQPEDNAAAAQHRRALNQHQLDSEPRPLQRVMIAAGSRYNLAPENHVKGNKSHRGLRTSTNLTRSVPKPTTTTSLLTGGSESNMSTNTPNLPRSASHMQIGNLAARSNGSAAQHQHQAVALTGAESIGCCGKLAKFLLFIANLFFWCTGIAMGAWGILVLVEDHKYNLSQLLVFEPSSRMSLFQLLAWSFITLGGAAILIGICGCSALVKNSRWILGLYIFLILAIFALDLATGLLAIIFQERLVANVRLRLVSKLRNEYGIQASFTAAIDYIQTRFECCGLDGHFDYEQSLWRLQRLGGFEATVARTCCHLRNTLDDQAHVNPRPVNESMCQSTDVRFHQSYRFRRGCLDDLEKLIRHKIWTFTIGCGVVGATILVVLAVATCFCRSIPSNSQNGKDDGKKSSSNSSTSRKVPASRVQQQALMYTEAAAKKQSHHRHGHHGHH